MIFYIETAKKIVANYSYLVGLPLNDNVDINFVAIAPVNTNQQAEFFYYITQDNKPSRALNMVGCDRKKVVVMLIHREGSKLMRKELDGYLTEKGIAKIYNDEGVLI